jgi:hypothetical protein
MIASNAAAMPAPVAAPTLSAPAEEHEGFSFHDILEIANPLQHFPVVSTLYRSLTGDKIGTFDRIAGDTLYGGAIGFASSVADTIFEKITGKSFGDTVLSLLTGDDDSASANAASGSVGSTPVSIATSDISLTPPDVTNLDLTPAATPSGNEIAAIVPPDIASLDLSPSKGAGAEVSLAGLTPPDVEDLDLSRQKAVAAQPPVTAQSAAMAALIAANKANVQMPADISTPVPAATRMPRLLSTAAMQSTPALASLQASLTRSKIDPELAGRASYAYQRALGLAPPAPDGTVNPPAN